MAARTVPERFEGAVAADEQDAPNRFARVLLDLSARKLGGFPRTDTSPRVGAHVPE